MTKPYHK